MLLINLFRPFCNILAIAVSTLIFVGCQKGADEVMQESPVEPSGSGNHRLHAIYRFYESYPDDTALAIRFQYDDLGRISRLALSALGRPDYCIIRYLYQGNSKLAYQSTSITQSFSNLAETDTSYYFYDQGQLICDSSRQHSHYGTDLQNGTLKNSTVLRFTKVTDNHFQVKLKRKIFLGSTADDRDWDSGAIINENSPSAFEYRSIEAIPNTFYRHFIRYEFSAFKNPLKGLLPIYPIPDVIGYQGMLLNAMFERYWSRYQTDPNDLAELNRKITVVAQIDSLPVRVRLDYNINSESFPQEIWVYDYD